MRFTMRVSLPLRGLVSFLVLLLLAPGPASAQLGNDAQKCLLEMSKQLQKVAELMLADKRLTRGDGLVDTGALREGVSQRVLQTSQ